MASYVLASDCLCQNCQKYFSLNNERISTVINLDIEGFEKRRFEDGSLNRVRCDKCNTEFTFETKLVVFSFTGKFAIYVNPSPEFGLSSELTAPKIILPDGFIFREVNFLIEAREKTKIFSDGFSDTAMEKFKAEMFDDSVIKPIDEENIMYTSTVDGEHIFTVYDCNDNVVRTLSFPDTGCLNATSGIDIKSKHWLKINRLTINKLCKDG